MSDGKIINDPVFGFIKIPGGVLMDIIDHPLMQRLRHIKQVGLASIVFPGAQHTRFQHSLGAYWLMSEAFCLYADRERFKPYEKHHSTALDAARNAQALAARHLILYHTEEETLNTRKELYTREAKSVYTGPVFVPDDLEVVTLE